MPTPQDLLALDEMTLAERVLNEVTGSRQYDQFLTVGAPGSGFGNLGLGIPLLIRALGFAPRNDHKSLAVSNFLFAPRSNVTVQ